MPIVVKTNSFETEVLKSKQPVLVDFWGARCMPCKMQRPILLELAEEYAGQLKICMFNTDQEEGESEAEYQEKFKTILEYKVMNLPTLLLFQGGKAVRSLVGLHTKGELREILREEGLELNQQHAGDGEDG
ncbi:MAG: thiol reductase thioredoxin [Oscillospiraceae bacterium]|nr:thiol reductase thioredoxin [Oscillospiraceae bacterium]